MALDKDWKKYVEESREMGVDPIAVVVFSNFEQWFHRSRNARLASMWGFTGGINSSYSFLMAKPESQDILMASPLDMESDGENWEGIEWVSKHGLEKARVVVAIKVFRLETPYITIFSDGEDPLSKATFRVMEWMFRPPVGETSFDFSGAGVRFEGPHGSSITVFFTQEEQNHGLSKGKEMHKEQTGATDQGPATSSGEQGIQHIEGGGVEGILTPDSLTGREYPGELGSPDGGGERPAPELPGEIQDDGGDAIHGAVARESILV